MRSGVIGNGHVLLKCTTCPVCFPKTLNLTERSRVVRSSSSQLKSAVSCTASIDKESCVEPLALSSWPRRLSTQKGVVPKVTFVQECPSHRYFLIQAFRAHWPAAG